MQAESELQCLFPLKLNNAAVRGAGTASSHIPARADRMIGINAVQAMAMARSQEPLTP